MGICQGGAREPGGGQGQPWRPALPSLPAQSTPASHHSDTRVGPARTPTYTSPGHEGTPRSWPQALLSPSRCPPSPHSDHTWSPL